MIAATRPNVVLYSRSGCHLCDAARDVILQASKARSFAFSEHVLRDGDPLSEEFTDLVPVVFVDGTRVAYWRISLEQLLDALESAPS